MTTRTQTSTLAALPGLSPVGKLSTPLYTRLHLFVLALAKGVHLGTTEGNKSIQLAEAVLLPFDASA